MLAPPWISVPPPGYGGVEEVVSVLTETLVRRGHAVTLFCAPGSVSSATVVSLLETQHPDEIERSLYEVDHVARAFEAIELAHAYRHFDVIHDHCGFTAVAMADRIETPIVHTLHGQFTPATSAFYRHHAAKVALVGISRAQLASAPAQLGALPAIPNPLDVGAWPLRGTQGRLPAVDRADDTREGATAGDCGGPRCGGAADPRGRHPTGAAGLLRP